MNAINTCDHNSHAGITQVSSKRAV